jgi:hypothetical protein
VIPFIPTLFFFYNFILHEKKIEILLLLIFIGKYLTVIKVLKAKQLKDEFYFQYLHSSYAKYRN